MVTSAEYSQIYLQTFDLSSNSFPNATGTFDFSIGSARTIFFEDYFVILEYLAEAFGFVDTRLTIYKYEADKSDYVYQLSYNASSSYMMYPATNGKWFATFNLGNVVLFQLGSPNPVDITPTSIFTADSQVYGYRIMPDDSVVVMKSSSVDTYTVNGTEFVLNNTLEITLSNTGGIVLYDLTDTHFVNWNKSGGFQIYARNEQLGWDLIEDHVTNSTYPYRLTGGPPAPTTLIDPQTVMIRSQFGSDPRDYSNTNQNGFIMIISKADGTWKDQVLLASDFSDIDPFNTLGLSVLALDSNNVLIGVPQEGYNPYKRSADAVQDITPGNYGATYLLQRGADNMWEPTAKFTRSKTDGYFGANFGANKDNAYIVACDLIPNLPIQNCYPYSFRKCSIAPINVTCNDIVLDSCSDVDVTKLDLYTQNDPECGVASVEYSDVRLNNTKIIAGFKFTRPLVPPVTCEASVTCPVVYAPVSVSVPVAVSAPTTTKKTSGAVQLSALVAGVVLTTASLIL